MADAISKELPVIPSVPKELEREPLVLNKRSIGWISDQISGIAEGKTPKWWWALFIPSVVVTGICFAMIVYLMSTGVGVWGLQIPVAWAWDITNFVFWIGIGHAGTLISAILARQPHTDETRQIRNVGSKAASRQDHRLIVAADD